MTDLERLQTLIEIYEALLTTKGADRATAMLARCVGQEALQARLEYEKRVGIVTVQPECVTEAHVDWVRDGDEVIKESARTDASGRAFE